MGKTITSLLFYNGSLYFLILATLYVFITIFNTAPFLSGMSKSTTETLLATFYDPITSILVCRFMLSLREFDSSIASTTSRGAGSGYRSRVAVLTVLEFAAQPSDSLPVFIASFAHPVHIESDLNVIDDDYADLCEWQTINFNRDLAPLPLDTRGSGWSPTPPSEPFSLKYSA